MRFEKQVALKAGQNVDQNASRLFDCTMSISNISNGTKTTWLKHSFCVFVNIVPCQESLFVLVFLQGFFFFNPRIP